MSKNDKNSVQNASNPTIQLATEGDAQVLAKLRYDFRQKIAESSGEDCESEKAFVRRCAKWMQKSLGDESSGWVCLIAKINNAIVDHLWLEVF